MASCWAAPRPWAWENSNNALFSGGFWDGKGSNGVSHGGIQQEVGMGSSSQLYMETGKQSNEQQQQQQQQDQQQAEEGNLSKASSDAMGLKLGKRTYFEDPAPKGSAAAAAYPALVTVPVVRKKQRAAAQPPAPPTCQVEGCNTDLTGSKTYHRRHRVCEVHSKTPKNIVDGIQQRFCQQCSRFHVLGEFDDDKRSCRRRLAGHNERRRKPPQPEPFTLSAALGGASVPIFPGAMKAFMPQQYQQHLLDGAFGSWPCNSRLQKFKEDPQRTPILINTSSAGLHFHGQNRLQGSSIATNEGIYQFFKSPGSSGDCAQASLSMSLPADPGVLATPACNNGALSLLSAGPWGSAPFIQPSFAAAAQGSVKTISADYGSWS